MAESIQKLRFGEKNTNLKTLGERKIDLQYAAVADVALCARKGHTIIDIELD
jgi:hypothetical protein